MTIALDPRVRIEELQRELASLQPPVEQVEPVLLGYCRGCREYREARDECPVCHRLFQEKWEMLGELRRQYARALLTVQPVMRPDETPELFEKMDKGLGYSAPSNPMFVNNANNDLMRKAIRMLRATAMEHGLLLPDANDANGQEVEIEYQGERWVAWEATNGSIRRIRRVAQEDALSPYPEGFPGADRHEICPDCGQEFTGPQAKFAMTGHRRKHRQ